MIRRGRNKRSSTIYLTCVTMVRAAGVVKHGRHSGSDEVEILPDFAEI